MSAYGATRDPCDVTLLQALTRLDRARAPGVPGLDALGRLWGAAAASCRAAARQVSPAGGFARLRALSPEELAQALHKESNCLDPRRAALAALYPPPSFPGELDRSRSATWHGSADSGLDSALAGGGYDARYVLPFVSAAVRAGALGLGEAARVGLLSLALASLADEDVEVRKLAYAALAEALAALPGSSFKEKPQILLLLNAVRN